MLKQPIYVEFNLDAKVNNSKLIAISHVDDKYSETLEVAVKQNDRFVYMGGATVVAKMVLHREKDYLLSDSVPCTVNDNGNILIPFDNAVVKTLQGTVKIEVSISRDEDRLTLQFPLWVSVNGSILDSAEVTPESKGTIPELLKEAKEALDDSTAALEKLGSYDNLENKPQISGVTLSGDKTPDELGLQKKLTAGDNVEIDASGRISAKDTSNYNELSNKPTINGNVLMAYPMDNSAGYLGLQKKLFDSIQESEIDRAIEVGNSKNNGFYALLGSNDIFNGSVLFQYEFYGYYPMAGSTYGQYGKVFYQFKFPRINTNGEITEPLMYRISVPNIDGSLRRVVTDWTEISGGSEIASGIVNQNGTISFYDADGNLLFTTTGASVIGPKGDPGDDYVLNEQDKIDIANIVLQSLPTTQGVLYGNESN